MSVTAKVLCKEQRALNEFSPSEAKDESCFPLVYLRNELFFGMLMASRKACLTQNTQLIPTVALSELHSGHLSVFVKAVYDF